MAFPSPMSFLSFCKQHYQYLRHMASSTPPIKRSEQLAPLSREHHDGLLFAWKIRQGLKNGTDLSTIGRFVQWYWQAHLQHHFEQEEAAFVPAIPAGDVLVQQMAAEHRQIKESIYALSQSDSESALAALATLVNDHIRFEERILFPHIEKAVSTKVLNDMQAQFSDSEPNEVWEEEFWGRK